MDESSNLTAAGVEKEKKKAVRTNPFVEESRAHRLRDNGMAFLRWLGKQPGYVTKVANYQIAEALEIELDPGRAQSRRLGEALEALRVAGMIEVVFQPPHPRKNPTGRTITLTEDGAKLAGIPFDRKAFV